MTLTPGRQTFVRASWMAVFALALAFLFASLPGYALRVMDIRIDPVDAPPSFVIAVRAMGALASVATAAFSFALAALLFSRRERKPMALFVSFYLLGYGAALGGPLEIIAAYEHTILPKLTLVIQCIVLAMPSMLLFALFPNGKLVPRWMLYVALGTLLLIPVTFFAQPSELFNLSSPIVAAISLAFSIGLMFAGVYAQVYRYRRVSTLVERQQTKWFVFGLTLWMALWTLDSIPYVVTQNYPRGLPLPWWTPVSELVWWVTLIIVPATLTISILRYRLWDIDLIIRRTVVYGTLTASTMLLYVFLVATVGSLFEAAVHPVIALLATGLVAVIFQPLRERLQRAVDHLAYGERDDPYAVLSHLGQRLSATLVPDAVLPAIVETIAQALKLPCVAISLREGENFKIVAAYPASSAPTPQKERRKPPGDQIKGEVLPLVYQGETIGRLIFSPRTPGEPFTPLERRLLEDISQQAGVAAHAVRLTADLRHSRERLVTAREEERRRLRRDLHDGLGPQLASQTLTLSAARTLLRRDPEAADALLVEAMRHAQGAITDIRRLVYDLRPPALDDLGLVAALRAQAAQYEPSGVRISVVAPARLPPLPAAVEVACYRIAQEALTNVVRHAHAHSSQVCLALQNSGAPALLLEIADDGIGLDGEHRPGVGLTSMRERAEELGGTCAVQGGTGEGTRVTARLPLQRVPDTLQSGA